jgi:hypothetical protein
LFIFEAKAEARLPLPLVMVKGIALFKFPQYSTEVALHS